MTHNIILNFMDGKSSKYTIQLKTDTIETLLKNTTPNIDDLHLDDSSLIYSVFKEGNEDKLHYNTLLYTLFDQSNNNTSLILYGLGENITENIFNDYQNLYERLKNNNFLNTFTDIQDATYLMIKSRCNGFFSYNSILFDIYPMRYLHNMRSLKINNCKIENLSSLVYCKNLTELTIFGHSNIEDISCLTNIKVLNIYNSIYITDIYSTNVLPKLKTLHLSCCFDITRLSLLKFTPNITVLCIYNGNVIHDISDVNNLTKLNRLELTGCHNITDLSCIKDLLQLNYLTIRRCGIPDVSELKSLNYLKRLHISGCKNMSELETLSEDVCKKKSRYVIVVSNLICLYLIKLYFNT